jgi:hypothetical protein
MVPSDQPAKPVLIASPAHPAQIGQRIFSLGQKSTLDSVEKKEDVIDEYCIFGVTP